jgi:hypothetical protein
MLEMANLDKAVIENCQFVGAYLNVGHFIEAQVRGEIGAKLISIVQLGQMLKYKMFVLKMLVFRGQNFTIPV